MADPHRCLLMDPPWPERGGGQSKRGADRHYPLLSPKQILDVISNANVGPCDPEGCHLWLWVTNNYLQDGLWLMEQLGFRYISNVAWVKAEPVADGAEIFGDAKKFRLQKTGLGQYLRGLHELLLFGVLGKLPAVEAGQTVICAPRREHSRKPEEAYYLIEKVSPGPRLEMFARYARQGWDYWGNEGGVLL
jgi:N6-adenosine-specific RNA methylase IME4